MGCADCAQFDGVVGALADAVFELIDVLIERRSRVMFGGLSTAEHAIQVNATGLRFAALALIFVAKPIEAWSLSSPVSLATPYPSWLTWLMLNTIPGSLIGALIHAWLMRSKYRTITPSEIQS